MTILRSSAYRRTDTQANYFRERLLGTPPSVWVTMSFRKDVFDVRRVYHSHLKISDVLEYEKLARQEKPYSFWIAFVYDGVPECHASSKRDFAQSFGQR